MIDNPYDPLRTLPTSDEQVRRVAFGDWGMATFVSDGLEIVRISTSRGLDRRHLGGLSHGSGSRLLVVRPCQAINSRRKTATLLH